MAKGVFIVGTDTDIGKTVVTAGLMHVLRSNGYKAVYFKAALSGAVEVGNELVPGDTKLVSDVSKLEESYVNTTAYVYRTPVSPHLASKLENNPIDLDVIIEKYAYLKEKYDFIIAEGSGGVACPLIDDERGIYTIGSLIKDLNMSVIIVASAGLGTINHAVLTAKYLESLGIKIKGIIINRYEEDLFHDDNVKMIGKMTKLHILGKLKNIEDISNNVVEAIRTNSEKVFDAAEIIEYMEEL